MSMHPVDALKHCGANLTRKAESELRAICDELVDVPDELARVVKPRANGFSVFLPGWYRTTKDAESHLFRAFGEKTVEAQCGRIVLAASMVVEKLNNERCAQCRRKAREEWPRE